MGTRSGGGDPGGGQPSPVITQVDSITELLEMCFFPNSVFNLSQFQHSPFVAIDPSLYGSTYIEVDVSVTLERDENNIPTVTSFLCSSAAMVFYPTPPTYVFDPDFGYIPNVPPGTMFGPISINLSSTDFTVTDVYLQPDGSAMSGRYLLYATGIFNRFDNVGTVSCAAFIPNHIYM